MFVDLELVSLLRPTPGIYHRFVEVFGRDNAEIRAWLYRYTRPGEPTPCACDLVVRTLAGDLFVRDFERKADGWWRDSDGFVSESLAALLPDEVRTLELQHVTELDSIEVTA